VITKTGRKSNLQIWRDIGVTLDSFSKYFLHKHEADISQSGI